MCKYRITLLFVCTAFLMLALPHAGVAQKQYWGIYSKPVESALPTIQTPLLFGGIIRTDSIAMNPEVLVAFDTSFTTSLGMSITSCGLMQASNGLIYYMTQENNLPYRSRIVAYNPVTDSTWEAALLGGTDFTYRGQREVSSLVEGLPGKLVDATSNGTLTSTAVYSFNLATNALDVIAPIPTGVSSNGSIVHPTLLGTLSKATNGKLYAGQTPWDLSSGKLIEVDPIGQSYTTLFDSHVAGPIPGYYFNGEMKQVGQSLYCTTGYGGTTFTPLLGANGLGVIGALDLTTNTYQKKLDLDSSAFGTAHGFVTVGDGLLYGEATANDTTAPGWSSPGCLFAYNPATNTLQRKVIYGKAPLGYDITGPFTNPGLLAASNGKIYGSFRKGLFEYDPVADTLRLRAPLQYLWNGQLYPYGLNSPLIEICRKPNYKPRSTTAFNLCAGSHFAYDLQNVNATTVVWRRNGNVVPAQTDQRLEFAAITPADAGAWACTLTNQCGTTQPPPITITVQSGSFTASTIGGDTLLCGTGDTAILTGNNGGTWNTGATTPTLAVTQAGTYFVTNQNACGQSTSNLLHVAHLDSAKVPPTVWSENYQTGQLGTRYICPGEESVLTGNVVGPWGMYTPGIWSTGETGPSITVQDTGNYYVHIANACNADTTFVLHALLIQPAPLPQVSFFNAPYGQPADPYLCGNDSVYLYTTSQYYYPLLDSTGQYLILLGGGQWFAPFYRVPGPGTYYLISNGCPGVADTLPITIYHADAPPTQAPVILPDQALLTGCVLDTTFLHTTDPLTYWSWYNPGMVRDTSLVLQVDWNLTSYTLTAFNGCGDGPSDAIGLQGIPVPQVAYTENTGTACINHAPFNLSPGSPAGGTYSGAGVAGNTFSPAVAGAGTHTITYSYGQGNCARQATSTILVDLCAAVAETSVPQAVRISPNPNTGTFTVEVLAAFTNANATLCDAQGRAVAPTIPLKPGRNTINQKNLAPGLYQLRLEIDGKVENQGVVIVPR